MKKSLILVSIVLVLVACSREDPIEFGTRKDLIIETRHDAYVESGKEFALKLLEEYKSLENGNFTLSPLSLEYTLGMINLAADGSASQEICSALGYGDNKEDVSSYLKGLRKQLEEVDKSTSLFQANGVYLDKKYSFDHSYLQSVKQCFNADARELDFTQPSSAAKEINEWIKKNTKSNIPKALEKLSAGIDALFINALYFNGKWSSKFNSANTKKEPFNTVEGKTTTVEMMCQERDFDYYKSDHFKAATLPYGNGTYNMVIVLPDKEYSLDSVLSEMNPDIWNSIVKESTSMTLKLSLPRFKIDYSTDLIPAMMAMGINSVFEEETALSSMADDFKGNVSQMDQSISLEVDESGTKASVITKAVSGLVMNLPMTFKADRPFAYFIMEKSTGIILVEGVLRLP